MNSSSSSSQSNILFPFLLVLLGSYIVIDFPSLLVVLAPPQIQLKQQRTRPGTGVGGVGAGPGRAPQSVQSSLKNIYGTAVLRLPGLAATVESRAGLRTDGTDYCEAWSKSPVRERESTGGSSRAEERERER
jgi:hypothetical protein